MSAINKVSGAVRHYTKTPKDTAFNSAVKFGKDCLGAAAKTLVVAIVIIPLAIAAIFGDKQARDYILGPDREWKDLHRKYTNLRKEDARKDISIDYKAKYASYLQAKSPNDPAVAAFKQFITCNRINIMHLMNCNHNYKYREYVEALDFRFTALTPFNHQGVDQASICRVDRVIAPPFWQAVYDQL